jgi:Phosphorylase superfamily
MTAMMAFTPPGSLVSLSNITPASSSHLSAWPSRPRSLPDPACWSSVAALGASWRRWLRAPRGKDTTASSASALPADLPPVFAPETGSSRPPSLNRTPFARRTQRGRAGYAPIIGVDAPIAEPAIKRELHRTTGAAAVDMESHVVARLAAANGLAFAAVRVIVDPAHRAIPPAALLGMAPDGRADIWAVLRNLMARPSQLSLLARIAVDAFAARAEMLRVRRLLGPHFGLADLTSSDSAMIRLPV